MADRARHGPDPALLGQPKLNYLGYSYGTWLGAKYASLFPASAGKVVLDSSVNWQGRLQADFEDFPVIDQRQFDAVYVPWLTRSSRTCWARHRPWSKQNWEQVAGLLEAHGVSPDNFDARLRRHGQPSPVAAGDR